MRAYSRRLVFEAVTELRLKEGSGELGYTRSPIIFFKIWRLLGFEQDFSCH